MTSLGDIASSRPAYFGWMLPSVLVLSWYFVWGLWMRPVESVSKRTLSEAPSASYIAMPNTEFKDHSWITDSLLLWSPAVFALPSAMGFSRAALTNTIGTRPPLQVPSRAPVFMDRPIRAKSAADFRFTWDFNESVWEALTNLSDRLRESFLLGSVVTTGTVLHLEWLSGLNEQRLGTIDVPSDEFLLKDKPWEVSAFIEFNEEGGVSSVFLETKSTFNDVDAALLRSLWRWQMKEAKEPLSGRVMFRSLGRLPISSKPQGTGSL